MIYIKRLLNAEVGDKPRNIGLKNDIAESFFNLNIGTKKKLTFIDKINKHEGELTSVTGNNPQITGEFFSYIKSVASLNDLLVFYSTSDDSVFGYKIINKNDDEYSKYNWLIDLYGTKYQSTSTHLLIHTDAEQPTQNTPSLPTPTDLPDFPLQQIFYGAPGTGKSHGIKDKESQFSEVIRTTFHPDSDYSTFVGAYKPVMDDVRKCVVIDKEEKEVKPLDGGSEFERRIAYKFIKQAFLKAYISAWKGSKENKPVLLVIEEINRGNCAQIFGDIFQLLDRDESGYSSYSIDADDDIQRELSDVFKEANIDIEEIKNGTKLLLPPNLYIWATMNTSDQSLFPIDSAFKRRWDWKYVPIDTRKENWVIEADGKNYSWSSFLEVINVHIHKATSSEDKMLGFYFCKAENGRITSERFVSKVLFYLYNDIFKDYGLDSFEFLKTEGTDEPISFRSFYGTDGKVVESQVATLLENLGVEKTEYVEVDEEVDSEEKESKKLKVTFADGTTIQGNTQFESYLESLKKIGLDKAEQISAKKTYARHRCQLISRVQEQGILDNNGFKYVEEQGYYIVKGIDLETMKNVLKEISKDLKLDLTVE